MAAKTQEIAAVLCADWGKDPRNRAVYMADVPARTVRRLTEKSWSFVSLLRAAEPWVGKGPVLLAFDVPLGFPQSYAAALARQSTIPSPATFLRVLQEATQVPDFYLETSAPGDWRITRPFFRVPGTKGGLRSYENAARQQGVNLYRTIDARTRGKTVFAKSGVPGSVGSAASVLWQELAPFLVNGRAFKVWPHDGELEVLLTKDAVIIAEIYPRAAYATALLDPTDGRWPALAVAKTKPDIRDSAIAALQRSGWVQRLQVKIDDLPNALDNEDDFDACVTASALLRCILEGLPLSASDLNVSRVEGGMLGTGTVDLSLPEKIWTARRAPEERTRLGALPQGNHDGRASGPASRKKRRSQLVTPTREPKAFPCPIPGCARIFVHSRGGWDGHVGSLRLHPQWHPELTEEDDRKEQFRGEFPRFFS